MMNRTACAAEQKTLRQKLRQKYILCAAVLLGTGALNLALCLIRSTNTNNLFLMVNIITDVCALWFTYTYLCLSIAPKRKWLALLKRTTLEETVTGQVIGITNHPQRTYGIGCVTVTLKTENGSRLLDWPIPPPPSLSPGIKIRAITVDNIVINWEEVQ